MNLKEITIFNYYLVKKEHLEFLTCKSLIFLLKLFNFISN